MYVYCGFFHSDFIFFFGFGVNVDALVGGGEGVFVEEIGSGEQDFFYLVGGPKLTDAGEVVFDDASEALDLV